MNESGRAVQQALESFKLDPASLLVVHDESDLEDVARSRCASEAASLGYGCAPSTSSSRHAGIPCACAFGVARPRRRLLAAFAPCRRTGGDDVESLVGRPRHAVECILAEGLDERARRRYN